MLDKAVLFIIFNRPEFTEKVFKVIREAKPGRLFVAADGPRNPEEKISTDLTRSKVSNIDWDCEVYYHYSDINLGCGVRPATAIDWAFSFVDELIIIEDDCLPNLSFFDFCSELLTRYKFDDRIGTINGITIPQSSAHIRESYYFSRFSVIWGWATWKRVWDNYDFHLSDWESLRDSNWLINAFSGNEYFATGFKGMFDTVKKGWDVWDAQLFYMCFKHHYLNIHPSKNLITNMGFDGSGTHTHQPTISYANMPASTIGTLVHPSIFVYDFKADNKIFEALYKYEMKSTGTINILFKKLKFQVKKILNNG